MARDGLVGATAEVLRSRVGFVGRQAELRAVLGHVNAAPSLTVVSGPAGIGKTRLLGEVANQLERPVLYGRSWRGSHITPFVPWTQVVSGARQILGSQEIGRFRDLAPLISGVGPRPRFAHSDSMQHVLAMALGDYLRQVADASGNGLVLVLDDLHHADAASISLTIALVSQRLPISILTTSRPLAEVPPDQRNLIESLTGEAEVVELGPLDEVDVEALLAESHVPGAQHAAAIAAAGGSPLLLEDWMRTGSGSAGLEYGQSIIAQAAELSPAAQDLLSAASLVGGVFDISVVGEAVGLKVPAAMSHIELAVKAGLVESVDGSLTRFRFGHDAIRESLEASMEPQERSEGHRQLLAVLIARRGTAGEVDVSVLAAHASEAAFVGDPELAVNLNLEAGDSALARAAPAAALGNFQRAIDIGAAAGGKKRVRAIVELGVARAHKMAGDPRAAPALIAVLEAADADLDVVDLGVEAVLLLPTNLGGLGLGPDRDATLVGWLEWALNAIGPDPSATRGRLLVELGIQTYAKSATQGEELLIEAAQIAEACDDDALLVNAVCHRHWFRRFPADMDSVLSTIDGLERRISSADTELRLSLAGLRSATLMRAGRFTEALAEIHTLEAELSPLPLSAQWSIGRWRAAISYVRGDHRGAEETGLGAFALVEQTPFGVTAFDYLAVLLASVMQARLEHEAIVEMVSSMVDSPSPLMATPAKAGAAMIMAEMGRIGEARELLAQVPRDVLAYRDPYELAWLPGATFLAQASVALNDADQAAEYVNSLEPYRHEWIVLGSGFMCFGPVALRRAQVALTAGLAEIAAVDLALARQEIMASGARMFEPVLLCAEADLAVLGDDLAASVSALEQAAQVCTELELDAAAGMVAARAFELVADTTLPVLGHLERTMRRDGAVWRVEFDGESVAVAHLKGMLALEVLLHSPKREFHVLEISAVLDSTSTGLLGETPGERREQRDQLLDPHAVSQYRQRVTDLQVTIDEAERFHDSERASLARSEMDTIVNELTRATGLGGRPRNGANSSERARVRITKLIRSAIGRIDDVAPAAGSDLSYTIKTGVFCSYDPGISERPWRVGRS